MISVIIPVLNSARGLRRTLTSLVVEKSGHEILVADAGSIDGSVAAVRETGWAKLVRTSGSRAARMNHAATKARGDILLFLEAGTILERGWAAAVEAAAATPGFALGCFRLEIAGCHPCLRGAEKASTFRTRLTRLARINQAPFVKTTDVEGAQVFLDAGTLEGVDLAKRMGKRGRVVLLHLHAVVPADRWRETGPHRRILRDGLALHKWHHGAQPRLLIEMGGDRRVSVIVFGTNPEPGKVKRWLAKLIGGERSARVYRTGISQVLATVDRARIEAEKYVFFRPQSARADVERWLGGSAMAVAQTGKTDTERRAHAVQTVLELSPGKALILGPHCPAMTTKELRQTLDGLDDCDLVLGPTDDGGCYLIGIKASHPKFFAQLSWDPDTLFQDAIDAAGATGLSHRALAPLMDFDSEEDLVMNWALGYMQD